MVERGDIAENSFAFTVDEGQRWERNAEGVPLRRISRISNLFDVSVKYILGAEVNIIAP